MLYFGTPEFAATILGRLLDAGSPVEVVGVVTQPDKPVGRKQVVVPPPVKVLAQQHGLPVLQPVSLRRPAAVDALRRFRPDLGVVAAYGRILRPDILEIPPHGHLNVHASLLPRWRGAWPIGEAIRADDAVTGVSIMQLDEGLDTGPVLALREEPILPDDTTGSLEARLAPIGADLLIETIPGFLSGAIAPRPQDDGQATYCRPIRKEDGLIDWRQPATSIERLVRAMIPWPGAYTFWEGKQLRILRSHVQPLPVAHQTLQSSAGLSDDGEPGALTKSTPGTVIRLGKDAAVVTGEGILVLDEVQLEGKNPAPARSFINGYRTFVGSQL